MTTGKRQRSQKQQRTQTDARNGSALRETDLSFVWNLWASVWLPVALFAVSLVPRISQNPILSRSVWSAAAVIAVWQILLYFQVNRTAAQKTLTVEFRSQHYIQAAVQAMVFAYWGYYWRPVYDHTWLLVAQLLFAYAFDMLLSWSRRNTYVLGFGPFPIIFSTNLFLWFRDDWFYLQFVMIAVGFLGKEYVRWNRAGRRVHIFNPSAFSLAIFSLILVGTDTTSLTFGQEIATTLSLAPQIYLFLFLIGLVVMYFFSITLVAGSAAIVLFGSSALYSMFTGTPYFVDSEIPTAVFLGLHLLVTDPSTSPRTRTGKVVFGVLYGVGVFGLYALLGGIGVPTFYDKLLCVPLLNLSVKGIDRLVGSLSDRSDLSRSQSMWSSQTVNLSYMAVWILFFGLMTLQGSTDGMHRGDAIPFWEQACADGRRGACERLLQIESSYCADNSGWACNQMGRHYTEGNLVEADTDQALRYFSKACELRFTVGCINVLTPGRIEQANPRLLDFRLLLREGGANLIEMSESNLYARACEHRWLFACDRTSEAGSGLGF
jgi:hypothetical protein